MAHVIDGAQWAFDGLANDIIAGLFEKALGRVSVALERGESVFIGDDFQTRMMFNGRDLWSLHNAESGVVLAEEVWIELAAWLNIAPLYADAEIWPEGMENTEISVDGAAAIDNPDLAWVHHSVRANFEIASLSLERDGKVATQSASGNADIFCIASDATHRNFWRQALSSRPPTIDNLKELSPHAYPDLLFIEGAIQSASTLVGGYPALRETVCKYLAVLSDSGRWAFTFPPPAISETEPVGPDLTARPTNQLIERRFRGLGLDFAPENPNVFANNTCRRAREVHYAGARLYCEWHGKFQPHRNRLYVHGPVPETENRVVIALFHEHLPLP